MALQISAMEKALSDLAKLQGVAGTCEGAFRDTPTRLETLLICMVNAMFLSLSIEMARALKDGIIVDDLGGSK